jgi:aspartate oxidase
MSASDSSQYYQKSGVQALLAKQQWSLEHLVDVVGSAGNSVCRALAVKAITGDRCNMPQHAPRYREDWACP